MERHILKTLKAEVLKLNEPTAAGRIYTTDCITNALEDPILKERLEQHVLFGTISPDDCWDMKNISHSVTDFELDDNKLMASIDVLDTPQGRTLSTLIDNNVIRFSICGKGNVENNLVTDYTIDCVTATLTEDKIS